MAKHRESMTRKWTFALTLLVLSMSTVHCFFSIISTSAVELKRSSFHKLAANTHKDQILSLINKNPVMVFSKSYCRHSKKLKQELHKLNVSFGELECDTVKDAFDVQGELYSLSKQRGYPNVYICGQHLDSLGTKSTGRWLRSRVIAGLRGWDREDMRTVRLIPSDDSFAEDWVTAASAA